MIEKNNNWPQFRVGCGYDVHKLAADRKLILCGVEIPYESGLLGHSDADVALHALMDALLGAAGLGDIGRHFPDTDMKFKDADSMLLLWHSGLSWLPILNRWRLILPGKCGLQEVLSM